MLTILLSIFKFFGGVFSGVLSFIKGHPTLASVLLLVAVATFATYHYTAKFKDQAAQLATAVEANKNLTNENKVLKSQNAKLTNDMKQLKAIAETYQSKVNDNKESVKTLENKVATPEFQQKAQTDIRGAEKDFNDSFNGYLDEINSETTSYAK